MLREPLAPSWKARQDPVMSLSEDKGTSSRRPKAPNFRTCPWCAKKEHQTGIQRPGSDRHGKPSQVALHLCSVLCSVCVELALRALGVDTLGSGLYSVCCRAP